MQSELSGNQHQLLRAFDQSAGGSPTTDVTASDAAQEAGFDPGSREFEAALGYLVDVGYLTRTGEGSVQDHGGRYKRGAAATAALGYPGPHQCRRVSAVACCVFASSQASLSTWVGSNRWFTTARAPFRSRSMRLAARSASCGAGGGRLWPRLVWTGTMHLTLE